MGSLARLVVIGAVFMIGASTASARQSVTLTSTADFQSGNNEGLITPAQNRVTRDRVSAGGVAGWSSTTAMPFARRDHTSIAHNGFMYAIGGVDDNTAPISDVSVAAINADGSVGAWSSTTPLPAERTDHASVAYNGFVYVIGGRDDYSPMSDVSVAVLYANGSVGTWIPTSALPSARTGLSSVAYNGFVYALGGYNGSDDLSAVLVAPINADGSLGAWSSTTALPSGRWLFSSVAYNGFLYAIGGVDADLVAFNDVLVAPINANGSLGAWSSTTALPTALGFNFAVAHAGFLYVLGGLETNLDLSGEVLVASINANGTVGDWTSTVALPSARFDHSSVAYNGFLYAVGGIDANGNTLSEIAVAPISADSANVNQAANRLRGFYSHLVDQQATFSTRSIVINGQASPGGVVRLRVRLAPENNNVFGAETVYDPAPLGSSIQISGTGRYLWIRLTLDDTGTSDADQATYISDITIGVGSPPSAGTVRDGPGADVDSQSSTTTIEANWSGFAASGGDALASYEWAIGTAPGLTNIQGWANVGLATTASNSNLSLGVGMKYVSVRAASAAGFTSAIASSDGVQVVAPVAAPGGDDGPTKKVCGLGVAGASGPWPALLAGIVLLSAAKLARGFRRIDKRRLDFFTSHIFRLF